MLSILDFLLSLAQDNPLLFGIVMFNIILVSYIGAYFTLYLYKRKHPEIMLNVLLWKTEIRRKSSCTTIEELYELVIRRLMKEKILSSNDGNGKLARDKSIYNVSDAEREVLEQIYGTYERKIYGSGAIKNEPEIVRSLLDRVLSV